jgi:hypothetical protein
MENETGESDSSESSEGESEARPGKPKVFLTNSFSWWYMLQRGGTIKVKSLAKIADVKKRLSGKRVEAFFWPDSNLIGKLTLYGVLPAPTNVKTPREAEELMQGGFFDWISKELSKQTGQFIREVSKPHQLEAGKSIILCEMILPETQSVIEIAGGPLEPQVKTFWFEIEALDLVPKPEAAGK